MCMNLSLAFGQTSVVRVCLWQNYRTIVYPLFWQINRAHHPSQKLNLMIFHGEKNSILMCHQINLGEEHQIKSGLCLSLISCTDNEGPEKATRGGWIEANQNSSLELGLYPKINLNPSLLTRPRPPSYKQAIGLRNRARNCNKSTEEF
jgi:hypothetical protein